MFSVQADWNFSQEQECIIIGLFEKPPKFDGPLAELDELLDGHLTQLVKSGDISAKKKAILKVHTFGKIGAKRLFFVGLGKESEANFETLLESFGKVFKTVQTNKLQEASIMLDSFQTENIDEDDVAQALSEAFALATYQFEGYKQKSNEPEKQIESIKVLGGTDEDSIDASLLVGYTYGKATNSARELVNLPGNMLTATDMANYAKNLAEKYDFELEILEKEEMEKLGMGAMLAVNQGSAEASKDDCIKIPRQRNLGRCYRASRKRNYL